MFQEAIKMAWQYKSGNNDFMAEVMELLDDVRVVPAERLLDACVHASFTPPDAPCTTATTTTQDTLGAVDDGVPAKTAAAAPASDGDAPGAGSGAASGATAD